MDSIKIIIYYYIIVCYDVNFEEPFSSQSHLLPSHADSQNTSKHLKHRDMKWHEGNDDLMIVMIGWFPRASLQAAAVCCAMAESDPENSANENSQSDWEATVTEESEAQRPFNPMQQMHILLWLFYICFMVVYLYYMCAYQLYYVHTIFPFSSLQSYRMFFASNDGPSILCFQKWCLMCLVECMLPRKHQNSPISSDILLFWPFGLDLFASPWTLPWHTLSWKITCSLTSEKCSCLVYIYHRKGGM